MIITQPFPFYCYQFVTIYFDCTVYCYLPIDYYMSSLLRSLVSLIICKQNQGHGAVGSPENATETERDGRGKQEKESCSARDDQKEVC